MPGLTHSHLIRRRSFRVLASDLAALAVVALAAGALACPGVTPTAVIRTAHRLCAEAEHGGPCGSPSAARGVA